MSSEDYPQYIADHAARSRSLLPRWWAAKPAFSALIKAVSDVFQRMEDERFDAYISRTLEFAEGPTLDLWGWTFGAGPRGGMNSRDYRRLVRLAIAVKFSNGNTDSLIRRWALATEPSQVEFYRYRIKGVAVVAYRAEWMDEVFAARAGAILRKGGPVANIMLFEALETHLGNSRRTASPLPANPTTNAPGAKVW